MCQSGPRVSKYIPTSQSLPRVSKSIDITLVSSECIYVSLYKSCTVRVYLRLFIHVRLIRVYLRIFILVCFVLVYLR